MGTNALELIASAHWANGIGLQFHYLIHNEILTDELDWYFGAGGQVRNGYNNDFDLGIDGVIGLEYTFEGDQFSAFLDGNVFLEIIDNPFRHGPRRALE